ncbi:hypothetical protein EAS64_36635 [Trebonia kvetii]|uniref:Cobalamin-independent methionine synthase MetE C-terminal/archaeal domain-containing protein n=1 Tax=Trebonia kvetii TaxID=2480626 RepID=A0A6P2BPJ1_9ACTN|nr:hypothetical protein EAS64_36635 [Trebonia kvetii]
MRHSAERIYTTHVGSLPRPAALLDLMKAAAEGRPVEPALRAEAERFAVADAVARQHAAGLDIVSDGEQSKTGFFAYIGQRLSGYEPRPDRSPLDGFKPEIDAFPEYYEQYLKSAMTGGTAAPAVPLGCTGPVTYIGQEQLWRDQLLDRVEGGEAGDRPAVRRGDQPGAARHTARPGAAAYLLRHQRGPAGARRAAVGPDRGPAHRLGVRPVLRGRQPAARARLPPVRDRPPAAGHGPAAGRDQPRHQHR